MIDIPASLNVLITADGDELGEWPDHEVTLRVDGNGELVEIEQPAIHDTGIGSKRIAKIIGSDTASETGRCIWKAAIAWIRDNPGEVASHLPPRRDLPGRPHFGSWAAGSRI